MTNDWGTQENWIRAALDISAGLIDSENPKCELIKYIDRNESPQFRRMAHEVLENNGILNQAKQLAKEMDLSI